MTMISLPSLARPCVALALVLASTLTVAPCAAQKKGTTARTLESGGVERVKALRDRLWTKLQDELEHIFLNGSWDQRLPNNLNVSFAFVEGEAMMMGIKDIAVSSGSACTSASLEPSYVLRALGVDVELAHPSIRFGVGRFNTEEEIDYVAARVIETVTRLREMSPLWEMVQEGIDLKSIQWAAH